VLRPETAAVARYLGEGYGVNPARPLSAEVKVWLDAADVVT